MTNIAGAIRISNMSDSTSTIHAPQSYTAFLETDLETFAAYLRTKSPEFWRTYKDENLTSHQVMLNPLRFNPPVDLNARFPVVWRTGESPPTPPKNITKHTRATFYECAVTELESGDFEVTAETDYASFDLQTLSATRFKVVAAFNPTTDFSRAQCQKLISALTEDYPELLRGSAAIDNSKLNNLPTTQVSLRIQSRRRDVARYSQEGQVIAWIAKKLKVSERTVKADIAAIKAGK